MRDLQNCDVLFPPDLDAAGGLEIVPVNDDVAEKVEGDGNPGDGGMTEQLRKAEESGRAMVVGVQEGKGLLFEEEEEGVN